MGLGSAGVISCLLVVSSSQFLRLAALLGIARIPIAHAGIWEENEDSDGEPIQTFAIITTESNSLVAEVHNRMPVLFHREDERVWLEQDTKPERALSVLRPYPAELMQMYKVSKKVNCAMVDDPELIEPRHCGKGEDNSLL